MKKRCLIVLSVLLAALSLWGCSGAAERLNLGTGGVGGRYYSFGTALARECSENMELRVKTTAGSAANLRLLKKGFLDLAIVQSDTLMDAVNGTGAFAGEACTGLQTVAELYVEECQIVVPAESDIRTVADLRGKRVSVGEEESGVRQNAEQILLVNGMSVASVDASYLSFADSAAAMERGELDAFFCTAGAPVDAVTELAGKLPVRLLSLDADTIGHLIADYPCYTACTIPAGAYAGQEETVQTVGVRAVLVAAENVDDEMIKTIAAVIRDTGMAGLD